MNEFMQDLDLVEILALGWFLLCWIGYSLFSGYKHRKRKRLQDGLHEHIQQWIHVMQHRDMRIVDTAVIGSIERNATFFASSTLLIIAGLITAMGSIDKAVNFMLTTPLVTARDSNFLQMVLLILVVIFAYAFFTFTWSMRQWSFAAIMVGNMPIDPPQNPPAESELRHSKALSEMVWLAVYHFNSGLRAYYFSLALLTWLIHPLLFIFASSWIVLVLFRREFHSRTLDALLTGLPKDS